MNRSKKNSDKKKKKELRRSANNKRLPSRSLKKKSSLSKEERKSSERRPRKSGRESSSKNMRRSRREELLCKEPERKWRKEDDFKSNRREKESSLTDVEERSETTRIDKSLKLMMMSISKRKELSLCKEQELNQREKLERPDVSQDNQGTPRSLNREETESRAQEERLSSLLSEMKERTNSMHQLPQLKAKSLVSAEKWLSQVLLARKLSRDSRKS